MHYKFMGASRPDLISKRDTTRYSEDTMTKLDKEERIWYPDKPEQRPKLKRYLNEMPGNVVDNV